MSNLKIILILNALTAFTASVSYSIGSVYCYSILGVSVATLSLLDGVSEGIGHFIKMFDGLFRDITKRNKLIMVLGLVLGLLSKFFLLASSCGFVFLVFSRLSERLSNGFVAISRDVAVSELSVNQNSHSLFSLTTTFRNIGCILGSFLVGAYLSYCDNYTILITISIIPALIAFLIGLQLKNNNNIKKFDYQEISVKIKEVFKNKTFINVLVLVILFLLARYNDSVMILRIRTLGYSDAFCSSIIGIFNAVGLISTYLWYKKTKNTPPNECKNIHWLVAIIGLGFVINNYCLIVPELSVISTGIWGVQRALSSVLFPVIITMITPPETRGTSFGVVAIVTAIFSVISGLIYSKIVSVNYEAVFMFSNIFIILFCFYYSLSVKNKLNTITN